MVLQVEEATAMDQVTAETVAATAATDEDSATEVLEDGVEAVAVAVEAA